MTIAKDTPTPPEAGQNGLASLQSQSSSQRLNQIDRIRARGVGDHISLPQIVVCGDQSAGKSSVLEGITSIPFPRQDGVCTRFATEIILRHQPGPTRIVAKVLPCASRTEDERAPMLAFERQLTSFDGLPDVIQEVSVLMGISSVSEEGDSSTSFSTDVLRLEVVGETGLHLTVVDLPGLISVSEDPNDVSIVESLVDKYLESSRTIILAVVPAYNDIDTQGIIQRARKFDKAGERTVGIITKPDLINKGTEARVATLAKNMDRVKLKLGFFLLKNPSPAELREGINAAQRQQMETEYFKTTPWKEQNLDKTRVGIENLRIFLQQLLADHIERELPKVRKEGEELLSRTDSDLHQLGPERSSPVQTRMYLIQKSMEFHTLTKAAIDGNYDGRDARFFGPETESSSLARLRATIHIENEKFSTYMRTKGAKRQINQNILPSDEAEELTPPPECSDSDSSKEDQILLSKAQMIQWVEEIYHKTRGRELPGNYNHVLISELFHQQSSRWGDIARAHLQTISDHVQRFVRAVLDHVINDNTVRTGVKYQINSSLGSLIKNAKEELNKILLDEQDQPITYNHYYTDNIQKARADTAKQKLNDTISHTVKNDWAGRLHVSNTADDLSRFVSSLQTRVVVDMTQQACLESLAALNAYYKVAMKTFIDNICRQVIERHLLKGLTEVFDPVFVGKLSDDELLKIAAETTEVCRIANATECSGSESGRTSRLSKHICEVC